MAGSSDRDEILARFRTKRDWGARLRAVAGALDRPDADDLLAEMYRLAISPDGALIAAHLGDLEGAAGSAVLRDAARATGPGTQMLRCAALVALAKRDDEQATPLLREALRSRDGVVKEYALIGLAGAGNDDVWDDVAARLALLVRKRFEDHASPTPVIWSVAYLGRHTREDRDRRLRLVSLARRQWSRRIPEEIDWFARYWPAVMPGGASDELVGSPDADALMAWVRSEPMFAPAGWLVDWYRRLD